MCSEKQIAKDIYRIGLGKAWQRHTEPMYGHGGQIIVKKKRTQTIGRRTLKANRKKRERNRRKDDGAIFSVLGSPYRCTIYRRKSSALTTTNYHLVSAYTAMSCNLERTSQGERRNNEEKSTTNHLIIWLSATSSHKEMKLNKEQATICANLIRSSCVKCASAHYRESLRNQDENCHPEPSKARCLWIFFFSSIYLCTLSFVYAAVRSVFFFS